RQVQVKKVDLMRVSKRLKRFTDATKLMLSICHPVERLLLPDDLADAFRLVCLRRGRLGAEADEQRFVVHGLERSSELHCVAPDASDCVDSHQNTTWPGIDHHALARPRKCSALSSRWRCSRSHAARSASPAFQPIFACQPMRSRSLVVSATK